MSDRESLIPCLHRVAQSPALELVPIKQKVARAFVLTHHRHNRSLPAGDVIRVGLRVGGELVAVAMAGYPIAEGLNDGRSLEVEVFGSATVPVRGWLIPHRASLSIGKRDVFELDLDAISDEQRDRLIRHLAAKFGADEATVRATLRSEGVAILADDCVVSSDGMDFL